MVKDCGAVGPTQQCVPLWILLFCHQVSAEVLRGNIYFIDGESGILTVPAPPLINGTEFSWEWTPHHGGLTDIQIATVTMHSQHSLWILKHQSFRLGDYFEILMHKDFQNAGVYSFKQTQPVLALLVQFEIFAVKITSFSKNPVGFDVSGRCEISHLPKSFTLQWEKEGDPTTNTTLLYNNTAYIIIHSANLQCNGKYICTVRRENGKRPLFTASSELTVTEYTFGTSSTLYRGSSNSSAVELTCQSIHAYGRAAWSRQQRPAMTPEALVSAGRNQATQTERKTIRERFSFLGFNGQHFPLRIAPLKFEDSGVYTCRFGQHVFAQVTLVNIQASAEPPGGVSRYQPVVLNCMVSEVPETLTLAWLRMEGLRGVLVKQGVLERSVSARNLSLTLPRLSEDQLHWECAVFRESMLRARVPLHLTLLPEGNTPMIVLMCVGVVCVGMLTSLLLLYYRRRAAAALAASPGTGNHTHAKFEAVYCDVTDLQEEGDNPNADKAAGSEVLYSAISLGGSSTDQKKKHNPEPGSEGQADVVYSVLRIR